MFPSGVGYIETADSIDIGIGGGAAHGTRLLLKNKAMGSACGRERHLAGCGQPKQVERITYIAGDLKIIISFILKITVHTHLFCLFSFYFISYPYIFLFSLTSSFEMKNNENK